MVTAIAVIILSYDTAETIDETEVTPLTTQKYGSQKTLFASLLTIFLIASLAFSCLTAFCIQIPTVIVCEVGCGITIISALLVMRYTIPLHADEATASFNPGKPFVQGATVLVNMILLLHLESKALLQLGIYFLVGIVVYFGYGIFFSKVTAEKQSQFGKLLTSESTDEDEPTTSIFSID